MIGHVVLFATALASLAACGVCQSPVVFSAARETGPQPGRCCFPYQWSAKMIQLDTVNTETITVLDTQMDLVRNLQATLNFTGSLETPVNKVVLDYNQKMLYIVPTSDPSLCYKVPFYMPSGRCIPDQAEHLGESYLGPMGPGQLPYDGWRIRVPMGNSSVVITLAVTKTGCVPLMEGISYPDNPSQNQLYMFSDFQPNLRDPSVFDLPASCHH